MKMKLCGVVKALYIQSPGLKIVYAAQSLVAALTLALLAFLIIQLCHRRNFALNVRLLMVNLCMALLFANIGTLLSALYHLHVPIFRPPETHCYWLQFTFADCYMIRTIFNVAVLGVYTSSVCFAIERMIGSLFLIADKRVRKHFSIGLVVAQWLISSSIAIFPHSATVNPSALFAHCTALVPTPTQTRPFFFAIVGMQMFALAIYFILTYHNNFDPLVNAELSQSNLLVQENVKSTEQTLPAVACVILLFLTSVFLDRNFVATMMDVLKNGRFTSFVPNGTLSQNAYWSELQTLAVPMVSLVFVGVLAFQIWSQMNSERIYEHVLSEFDVPEDFYENRSDTLSLTMTPSDQSPSINVRLGCNKDKMKGLGDNKGKGSTGQLWTTNTSTSSEKSLTSENQSNGK